MSASIRLLKRQMQGQLRTTEWRALLIATWIAITLTTLLSLLGDRLERGLLRESASVLGADMVLSSQRPIQDLRQRQAAEAGLTSTSVIQFPSMISVGDDMMLSSVRIVQSPYPLRGQIQTRPAQETDIPEPGHAWVEARVMSQLGLSLGDKIELGYTELIVNAELISSPDRGSGFRSFSPQILVNEADLDASGILAPGSRAEFRLLLSGSTEQVNAFAQLLNENLGDEERLFTLQNEQPMGGNALASALNYLKLTSLIALLLSALTIFLSLKRFSQSQHLRCALLLSLGMTQRSMVTLYLMQLLLAWAVLALMGSLTGIALEQMVSRWLDELLPQSLPAPALWRYFTGAGVGLALLVLLGLPPILGLSKVSVSALFRDEDIKTERRGLALQLICALLLLAVLLSFLEAPIAALILLLFLLIGGAVLGSIAQFCLKHLATPLAKRLLLGRLLVMRLRQQRQWHRLQSAVAILLLTLLSVVWISRTDLLEDWQAQIPDDTPNYFVVNIQPWQTEGLQSFLDDANVGAVFFPMVRGRITTLNGAPIHAQMTPEQLEHNTLNRELNLSWSNHAPAHNTMTEGKWWQGETSGPLISVEEEMAQILGLKLGDVLGFDLAGLEVEAQIANLRSVEWTSFQPNFYVIFDEATLNQFPATYITSFRLGQEQQELANQLIREFPSLTLIDIDQMLLQLSQWLTRLGDSSALILALSLICGAMLMLLTLQQALEQRRYEGALLQTLGANAKQTQHLDLLELMLLGGLCGFMAAIIAEGIIALLYIHLLDITPQLHLGLWLALPLASFAFFTVSGALLRKRLTLDQCYRLLRAH